MGNTFDSKGGEQNIAQGDHATGKQENVTQELRGDGNISSGTGNVTVNNHGVPLKPKTVVIASVLAAAVLGASLAGWHLLAPAGKSASTTGSNAPAIIAEKGNVTVTYNNSTIPPQRLEELAGQLAVTDSALASFFKIIEQEKVPPGDLDSKLREIAANYKELLARVGDDQAAKQAIEAGDYAKAEKLLEDAANQHNLAAAKAHADNARLQEVQLRYAKAAAYWQKAAALLPEDKKNERSLYLHEAAYDFDRIARYGEALPLYEQSLAIRQETSNKAGEGTTLNNISQIYYAKADYPTALKYLEQSLVIHREVGNRAVEGAILNNISQIYDAWGDYPTALKYLEQSLVIRQEIGDRDGEGTTLNNISQIYKARGDYTTALKYLEQSLSISREIGDKAGEGCALNNIGDIYSAWREHDKALKYIEQSLSISRETGDKVGEGTTLNNISQIYHNRGDYGTALKYLEQSLVIRQKIGDRAGEGTTLSNISLIYSARADYPTALKYLEQSLSISREIGDKVGEAVTSWNIGMLYNTQGNMRKAEPYVSRAAQLTEALGHPKMKECREALICIRAQLKTQ
jgi:tetratricopeptide (TPR) repeat protein